MSAPQRPNIILINCDDLGYGDLGCYGSTLNRTPELDRLAAEGMRFSDFTMASAVCSPSRGAMLTGCYPPRIGFAEFDHGRGVLFPGSSTGLHPEEVTIAEILRQGGYATKMVGKWHCGDQPDFLPTRHGFEEYFGLPYSNDMGRQSAPGRTEMFPPLPLLRGEEIVELQPDQAQLTGRYLAECVEFMRANRGKPFFLYLAHMYVHLPIYAPENFLDRSRNGRYGAAVECIDWTLAGLRRELTGLGIGQNTLIIFTSDNGSRASGGGSNGHLRGTKGSLWEGGFRVPCLMHWPGRIKAGSVCGEHVSALDFLPTLAAAGGADPPRDRTIDGRDLSSLLAGGPGDEADDFAYYIGETLGAVRSGKWKLHVHRGGVLSELYDLAADPGESRDVAAENPDVVRTLQEKAAAYRDDLGDKGTRVKGRGRREPGRVANPKPLATYDPSHPYFCHEYDLPDIG